MCCPTSLVRNGTLRDVCSLREFASVALLSRAYQPIPYTYFPRTRTAIKWPAAPSVFPHVFSPLDADF